MKPNRSTAPLIAALACACLALPAAAADRMQAGQWSGTTTVAGKTFPTSTCMGPSDVAAMNGDVASVSKYLATTIPPEICALSNIHVNGNQIVYTSVCKGAGGIATAPNTVTTTYHSNSFESVDERGTKSEAKLTGPCK
jgi:hypothetical protein